MCAAYLAYHNTISTICPLKILVLFTYGECRCSTHTPKVEEPTVVVSYCHLFALILISELTYAESRWYAHTQQVLVDHEDGQKETIFGPDLDDSCPPPPNQDGYQPAAMDYHQEVHPLANNIHRHQKTNLSKRR